MKRVLSFSLAALAACSNGERRNHAAAPPETPMPLPTATAAPPPLPHIARKGGTDVTFAVVSDLHFGYGRIEATHELFIDRLNHVQGKPYPAYLQKAWGAAVGPVRGLLVAGDLTESGTAEQWELLAKTYGLAGDGTGSRVPLFEVIGNHDHGPGEYVESRVAARHGGGRVYAFQWDDLHVLALGEGPGDDAFAFMEKDLARVDANVPLLLLFHLPLAGPWSTGGWFADGDYRKRLAAVLEGRNVVAIFHGHHHATDHYTWQGIDVFKPGAVKSGGRECAVVHVTDHQLTVGTYDYVADGWSHTFAKRF